jgi:hypothetical protein
MGIMRKPGGIRQDPKEVYLSQGRSWVLDRGCADFRERALAEVR